LTVSNGEFGTIKLSIPTLNQDDLLMVNASADLANVSASVTKSAVATERLIKFIGSSADTVLTGFNFAVIKIIIAPAFSSIFAFDTDFETV